MFFFYVGACQLIRLAGLFSFFQFFFRAWTLSFVSFLKFSFIFISLCCATGCLWFSASGCSFLCFFKLKFFDGLWSIFVILNFFPVYLIVSFVLCVIFVFGLDLFWCCCVTEVTVSHSQRTLGRVHVGPLPSHVIVDLFFFMYSFVWCYYQVYLEQVKSGFSATFNECLWLWDFIFIYLFYILCFLLELLNSCLRSSVCFLNRWNNGPYLLYLLSVALNFSFLSAFLVLFFYFHFVFNVLFWFFWFVNFFLFWYPSVVFCFFWVWWFYTFFFF